DLNLRSHHRISGVLVLLLVALALAWAVFPSKSWPALPIALGACAVPLLFLNRDFYGFLLRRRGLWFALRAIPVHWLYYLYSAITFAVVNVQCRLRRRPAG